MKHFSLMLVMVLFVMSTALAQRTVTGTVLLEGDGEAIGANVVIDGDEGVGTVTEFDGTFSLEVPETAKALKISYTGYATQTVSIEGTDNVKVTLSNDVDLGIEVVVVGYSAVKEDQLSTGISVIGAEEIQNIPVANIGNLLQGKSTGVEVKGQNGKPGGGTFIRIRGVNSISSSNEPLFIVDGIPVTSAVYNAINPNDIESLSVLKDAAAASIYGSSASSGVVLVTTKKGSSKTSRPQIRFKSQYGFKQKTEDNFEMMNAQQKMDYETELFEKFEIGDAATVASYEVPAIRDSLLAVAGDWQDILLRTGTFQNYDVSMSGGADKIQYFASVGYYDEEGIAKGSSFDRMTARINTTYQAAEWLTLSNTIYVARTESAELRDRNNVQNPFRAMYDYNPYETEYLLNSQDPTDIQIDPDTGKPVYNLTNAGFSISEAIENNPEKEVEHHLIGSLAAEFKILPVKGLSFRTELNGNLRAYEREYFIKPNSVLDTYVGDADNPGIGTANFFRRWQYQFKNLIKYNTTINEDHNLNVLVGQEFQDLDSYSFRVSGNGFPNESLYTLNNAAIVDSGSSARYEEATLSGFSRVSYNYKRKYIGTFTYRTDGYSGFGSDYRFGHFFSGSVAWNIHYEDFFKGWAIDNISQLKVRLSAGQTGNRSGIDSYDRLGTVESSSFAGTSSFSVNQAPRPDLRWERAFSPSLGLDFGFFDNRIAGSLDLYSKKVTDLFAFSQSDDPDRFLSVRSNIGEMRNRGVELELNGDVVRMREQDLTISLFGSISYNSNEVLALPDDDGNPVTPSTIYLGSTINRVGLETNTYYLVRSAGVDPTTGNELWYDEDGNVTDVWSGDDAVALEGKTPQPKYQGNFGTNIRFKGVTIGASFYYQIDSYVLNYMAANMLSDGENITSNQRVDAADYWNAPGDITDIPRPTGVSYTSDRFLQRNDYLRLRDLRIGYDLPIKNNKWVNGVNIFVQGTNLATWTSYDGDPEVGIGSAESDLTLPGQVSLYSYPQTRGLTFGLDVNF